ncbi:hypothetical protein FF1_005989 [Malus domestica]
MRLRASNSLSDPPLAALCGLSSSLFITNPKGLKSNFATAYPLKSELSSPRTTKRTTAPYLNLKSDKSGLDSSRVRCTRVRIRQRFPVERVRGRAKS